MPTLPPLAAVLVAVGLAAPSSAQITEAWLRTDSTFSAGGFQADESGRNVITGTSVAASQAHILVRDGSGATTWSRTFDLGTTTDEQFGGARFAANGDILVPGLVMSAPGAPFQRHAVLVRYDAAGNLLWSRVTPTVGNGYEDPGSILEAPNGDVLMSGSSVGATTSEDITVWRFDSQGNILWTARVGGSQNRSDGGAGLVLAANGDIVVAGTANAYPPVNTDILLARFTGSGSMLWSREYSAGNGMEGMCSLTLDAAGRILIAARLAPPSGLDAGLLVYDANGTLLWTRTTGLQGAGGVKVAIDTHGDIVFLASTSDASFVHGYALRKYDPNGTLVWSVERPASHVAGFLLEPGDDVLVHGSAYAPHPYEHGSAERYDRHGSLRWAWSYGTGPTDSIRSLRHGPGASWFAFDSTASTSRVRRLERSSRATCFGDGSGTVCPCGNASAPIDRAGCTNSLGLAGRLDDAGVPRLSADTLRLDVTGVPDTSVLFFQGSADVAGGAGAVFGDGLRCAGGAVIRLATRSAVGGSASYPAAGEPSISARGLVPGPGTRWYQAWYRNAAGFCTPSTFNLSNALRVDWAG